MSYNNDNNIKKDLIELYEMLYDFSQNETAKSFFNKDLLKKLKYDPEDVKHLLQNEKIPINNKRLGTKIRPEISNIKTKEEVYNCLKENIFMIFQNEIDEIEKNNILKKITTEEIKYLYQIVFEMKPSDKIKKLEVLYKIKHFYDSKKRTADLMKNLY